MANVVFNGVTYSVPADGDNSWGPDLTAYFISIASNALQKSGGTFTLTAEAAFGATFGLKAPYLKSYATNPASAGAIRLGNLESVSFRNNANSADLALTSNASDALLFNSKNVLFSGLGLIVNADVSAAAAIAYSKLNLTGLVVNADIGASAAIAYSKLAALGLAKVVQTNAATGFLEASAVTNTTLSYLDATSSIQTQLNAKEATITTLPIAKGGTNNSALVVTAAQVLYTDGTKVISLANGTAGQVLQSNGTTVAPSWSSSPTITPPTITKLLTGSANYTTPANVKRIEIRLVGGGAGGQGSSDGAGDGGSGGAGGNSTFGTTLLVANGAALANSAGSAGGTASLGVAIGIALSGAAGSGRSQFTGAGNYALGISGAVSPFGGAGNGGSQAGGQVAGAGVANTGSGGGGGGGPSATTSVGGAGGGAGGFVSAILFPTAGQVYAYAIGAAGTAGAAGTGGTVGGAGGSGAAYLTEYY